jgi:hypothetical protein
MLNHEMRPRTRCGHEHYNVAMRRHAVPRVLNQLRRVDEADTAMRRNNVRPHSNRVVVVLPLNWRIAYSLGMLIAAAAQVRSYMWLAN